MRLLSATYRPAIAIAIARWSDAILEGMANAARAVPYVEQYTNGRVKLKGAHLDGEMHGAWDFYRLDGSLMRSGSFDRGKQIGTWRTYDRAGKVVKETGFK
jgi:antitoxin component YwqK of YwqJK toxin-antitoxin module